MTIFPALAAVGFTAFAVWLARLENPPTHGERATMSATSEPAIVIDRVVPLIGEDICVLDSHDRYTGRIYRVILPRTPGKPLYYDYDFWAACLCGERVTYPEPRKTT